MYQDKEIVDRREMLRIKLKSLMAESRIIRAEEKRTWGQFRNELHLHRVGVVRDEARHTHLAYGFIRGRTYEQMEEHAESKPDWARVRTMIKKYGPKNFEYPKVCAEPVRLVAVA